MIWTGWSTFPCEARSADLRSMGEGRPEGLHLGAIIRRMKVAAGERVGSVEGDQPFVRMNEGFLWESALEYVVAGVPMDEALEMAFKRYAREIRKNIAKQVRVEKDGIHMTPDGLDTEKGILESWKCTRKKIPATQADFEAKFWPWLVQEKSYALACGVDTVRWIVMFQAGDYSRGPGSGPQMLESTGTFTVDELVDNWNVVLRHAESLRGEACATGGSA